MFLSIQKKISEENFSNPSCKIKILTNLHYNLAIYDKQAQLWLCKSGPGMVFFISFFLQFEVVFINMPSSYWVVFIFDVVFAFEVIFIFGVILISKVVFIFEVVLIFEVVFILEIVLFF